MRVFVDEYVNRRLMPHLIGQTFIHAADTSWRGMKNGALLRTVAPDYDLFLTRDRNIPSQQNLKLFPLAFVILRARSNALADLLPLVPRLRAVLDQISANAIMPGDLYEVSPRSSRAPLP